MPNLVKKHNISFELERKMVDAAVAKAREIGISENVVILDDGGNLKAFGRMDGAPIPTIEMAQNTVQNDVDSPRAALVLASDAVPVG
jgi:uncharacterized protein GlcG (DUF336 family)